MMFVTAWLAIAGLAAISVPILIHLLLRRRRRPVEWGAMRLLIEAVRRHKRRARLEQILLLTIRCLVLILIGLALAEPIISGLRALGGGSRLVVLVIDDGLISGINDSTGQMDLDTSVANAQIVVDELAAGDRVALVSTSYPSQMLTDGPTVNHEAVNRMLDAMRPKAGASDLEGALDIAESIVREHAADSPTSVVLLGQWREGSLGGGSAEGLLGSETDEISWQEDRPVQLLATLPTEVPATVVAISDVSTRRPVDGARAERPPVRTTVTIKRMGTDLGTGRSLVRLSGPGMEEVLPRQIDWSPGRAEAMVEFIGRTDSGGAAIDGTSVVVAHVDDTRLPDVAKRSVLVDTTSTIRVGLIERQSFSSSAGLDQVESGEWIERALEPGDDGVIEVERIDPASLSARVLRNLDAVILARPDLINDADWTTMSDFTKSGGFLLVIPPTDQQSHQWLDRMGEEFDLTWTVAVESIEFEEPVELGSQQPGGDLLSLLESELDELAAPVEVSRRLQVDPDSSEGQILLQTIDEAPLLIAWGPSGDRHGTIALLTIAPHLEWTSLPIKPFMVPLMQELVREGSAAGRSSVAEVAGSYANVPVTGVRELTGPGGYNILVDRDGVSSEPLRRTGHWVARDANGAALSTVIVNADLSAANPTLVSADSFQTKLGSEENWTLLDATDLPGQFSEGQVNPVWSMVLLAVALLLIVIETALNRWFSRSRTPEPGTIPAVTTGGVT